MSFDIFLQAFENGDAAERDGAAVRKRLLRAAAPCEPDDGFVCFEDDLGNADIYGVPDEGSSFDSLMFQHVGGNGFGLIVEIARLADLVILIPGGPACVVHDGQRPHLPPELDDLGVELVTTGAALLDAIQRD